MSRKDAASLGDTDLLVEWGRIQPLDAWDAYGVSLAKEVVNRLVMRLGAYMDAVDEINQVLPVESRSNPSYSEGFNAALETIKEAVDRVLAEAYRGR